MTFSGLLRSCSLLICVTRMRGARINIVLILLGIIDEALFSHSVFFASSSFGVDSFGGPDYEVNDVYFFTTLGDFESSRPCAFIDLFEPDLLSVGVDTTTSSSLSSFAS